MILITGATGSLGTYLTEELQKEKISFDAPSRNGLNLLDANSINKFFENKQYDAVIHLAAETNVDLCEREPQRAYLTNSLATEIIARHTERMNGKIVYISTSAVFGTVPKISYCELDTPLPVGFYGSSKLQGEQSIQRINSKYLILRSSFMIGGGPQKDKKFLGKIIPELKNNRPVSVVRDKLGSLTYAKDMASFIVKSLADYHNCIIHLSSKDFCSRYDVVQHIKKVINSTSKIIPIDAQMFPLSAARPMSEALHSCYPLTGVQRSFHEIIEDYLKEWK